MMPVDGALRFDTFVVGSSNSLAASAARAVAEVPGQTYNPLFIYGESGRGKTHLVAAIAHRALEREPDVRVLFSSGEEVAEDLHHWIGTGQRHRFLEHYRQADLLILDDVQFLTGQRETQSELLRLLNSLMRGGQQLVLTSDRQPADIADVDQRLLSRLSGGLVVDVGAPDFEMRLAILRKVAGERGVSFADGVLDEVARMPFANVRELKGALNKLSAYQQLEEQPVVVADVRAVLGERAGAFGERSCSPEPLSSRSMMPERIAAIIPADTDYDGFLADVLQEVEARVESWRVRIGEAIAYWRPQGYSVTVLERAMNLTEEPDVEGLLAAYKSAVGQLRQLESQAVAIDPAASAHPVLHDPEAVWAAGELVAQMIAANAPLPAPSPGYRREALELSAGNQLALRAVDAVIDSPGRRFNPLFIRGPAGSGKSHVAHAIGNAMRAVDSRRRVACLTTTAFVEEFVAALQEGAVERWRSRYRSADVLIIDDIQHLAGKERTQDEVFRLFNHLVDRGCQIVLTADRPPGELTGLADRLRSRFEGGLVVNLPDRERMVNEPSVLKVAGDVDRFFEDREKMVWEWPELGARLIEEYR